ncbi:uncharacterized protein LOC116166467 [Photinus pyralis]|uniref:uncharacterized protein LOC116166467 n=1 Tax=Photinus pyralis TaxID=7054 RepID=UPI00126769DB|nr:uncharacterized protein LOC116166467 [Photinus pyralis]
MMHDFLEGCSKYIISFIVVKYVSELKLFTLDVLNKRIAGFDFGPDQRSKPCYLSWDHLVQGNVRLSASEMISFIRFFGLLIGDFIPTNDPMWRLYITLRTLLDMLMSSFFDLPTCDALETVVAELNELYLFFSKDTLKPKFHFLLHYATVIKRLGPPSKMWSMRFEAKHRISKIAARASFNRRNICLSLAVKHQLQMNDLFLKGALPNTWESGRERTVQNKGLILKQLGLKDKEILVQVPWVKVNGLTYRKGTILVYDVMEPNEITFCTVDMIYVCGDQRRVVYKCFIFSTLGFDEHFFAYEVDPKPSAEGTYLFHDSLSCFTPNHLIFAPNGKNYIIMREYL